MEVILKSNFHGCLAILCLALVGGVCTGNAKTEGVDREDLFFMEIPFVISVSKRMQSIDEAASSVMVLSGAEIRRTGATNLGAALRTLVGVDVRQAHASQHVLGLRGFTDTGHLLVTIDGNNAFMYHANHIFLDWAPLDIEEVDRIEVIKGPGGLFYGGNAFSGVINIITHQKVEGTSITAQAGSTEMYRGNLIHGGRLSDEWDYKVAVGVRGDREWNEPDLKQTVGHQGGELEADRFQTIFASGQMARDLGAESRLIFDFRYSQAENVISRVCNPTTGFLSARYERPDFWVRMHRNRHTKDFWDETFGVDDKNYELELMKIYRRNAHILSVGGYTKYTWWEVSKFAAEDSLGAVIPERKEDHAVEEFAINIEDEWRFNEQFMLSVGGRLDHYTELGLTGLGRASAIYVPEEGQSFRLTVATGHYLPSLFQQTNKGTAYPFAKGNPDLKQEKIRMYELAASMMLTEQIRLDGAFFYNITRDLIDNTQLGPMENGPGADQIGGEITLNYRLGASLNGSVGYAYLDTRHDGFKGYRVDPKHKVNLMAMVDLQGDRTLSLQGYYVSDYDEIYLTSNPVFGRIGAGPAPVDGYLMVDAQLALPLGKDLEVRLAAANLLGGKHFESNPQGAGWHTGDEIGRRVSVSLSHGIH